MLVGNPPPPLGLGPVLGSILPLVVGILPVNRSGHGGWQRRRRVGRHRRVVSCRARRDGGRARRGWHGRGVGGNNPRSSEGVLLFASGESGFYVGLLCSRYLLLFLSAASAPFRGQGVCRCGRRWGGGGRAVLHREPVVVEEEAVGDQDDHQHDDHRLGRVQFIEQTLPTLPIFVSPRPPHPPNHLRHQLHRGGGITPAPLSNAPARSTAVATK